MWGNFAIFAGMIRSHSNFDLTDHNTLAMHVRCRRFVEYDSPDDLPELFASIPDGTPVVHLGAGSNMLFLGDYEGVVVHSAVRGMEFSRCPDGSVLARVGAGETMDDFIQCACSMGLWGVENLSGIPGEAGSSAVQNVGAYGVEAADAIHSVEVYSRERGRHLTLSPADCGFAYRDSMFKHQPAKGDLTVTHVTYRLSEEPCPKVSYPALQKMFTYEPTSPGEVREAVIAIRDSKLPDPRVTPSAGSFFKNPVVSRGHFQKICVEGMPHYDVEGGVKIPAAWLLDRLGWKGRSMGHAAVWHLQPLVIVNPDREATPAEIVTLEKAMIRSVEERFGITLTPEVEHVETVNRTE